MFARIVCILAIVAGSTAVASRPASAQSKRDRALHHFEQGEAFFKVGAYDRAAEEYNAAYELVPRAGFLFNIALCHERLEDKQSAVDYYERYLAEEPDGVKSTEARARVVALRRLIDQERTDSEAAARERAETERKRREADEHIATARERMSAGDHAGAIAEYEAARALTDDPELLFSIAEAHQAAGERAAAIDAYDRYRDAVPDGARASEARARADKLRAQSRDIGGGDGAQKPPSPPSMIPAYAAYGVAAGFLGTALVFGVRAAGTRGDLEDALDNGDPPLDNGDERFDQGASNARIANITLGVGVVSLGVAGFLTWRAVRGRNAARDRDEGVSLAPAAAPGYAGMAVRVWW